MKAVSEFVLEAFGISPKALIKPIGSGHIHQTFQVDDGRKFILQRINKNVFTRPDVIARNNRLAAEYLFKKHPEYLFLTTIPDKQGNELVYGEDGFPWRLYPLIQNTSTIDFVSSHEEAFEAAKGFGLLARNLEGIDCDLFEPSLERFHNLSWRFDQFEAAIANATDFVLSQASEEIALARKFGYLVREYKNLINSGSLKLRITHNDTKINNILFNQDHSKAICVIDLDTLMPGYFIYDLGDMIRTCVSPVSEEEGDVTKIIFRKEIYDALLSGYLSEMRAFLLPAELEAVPFAGKMMTYIMALRFLADFLRGNTYYHITYPDQNKVRARNQLLLLNILTQAV